MPENWSESQPKLPDETKSQPERVSAEPTGFWADHRWDVVVGLIALLVLVYVAFIVLGGSRSGSVVVLEGGDSSTVRSLVARSDDRLVQMAQWTIGAVLTLGVALIGFNWVTSNRNYDRDRAALNEYKEDIGRRLEDALSKQLDQIAVVERQAQTLEKRTSESLEELSKETHKLRWEIEVAKMDISSSNMLSGMTRSMESLGRMQRFLDQGNLDLLLWEFCHTHLVLLLLGRVDVRNDYVDKSYALMSQVVNKFPLAALPGQKLGADLRSQLDSTRNAIATSDSPHEGMLGILDGLLDRE